MNRLEQNGDWISKLRLTKGKASEKRHGDQEAKDDNANNVNQTQIVLVFSWKTLHSPMQSNHLGLQKTLPLMSHPSSTPNPSTGKVNVHYMCTSWMG